MQLTPVSDPLVSLIAQLDALTVGELKLPLHWITATNARYALCRREDSATSPVASPCAHIVTSMLAAEVCEDCPLSTTSQKTRQ